MRYHFARSSLVRILYKISYKPSSQMIADILIQPLKRNLFHEFHRNLGLVPYIKNERFEARWCVEE